MKSICDNSGKPKEIASARGAGEVFDELKSIAIRFLERTEKDQMRSDYIIATVHTNLKVRADQGDEWATAMVIWLDGQIQVLNSIRSAVGDTIIVGKSGISPNG